MTLTLTKHEPAETETLEQRVAQLERDLAELRQSIAGKSQGYRRPGAETDNDASWRQ